MSNGSHSMESKVHEWLTSQGYPLEMYVARTFNQSGFRVVQSDYFEDTESGDSREIDVNAFAQESVGDVLLRITFAIECKVTPSKPWVLFTQRRQLGDPARVAQRGCSKIGRKLVKTLAHNATVQALPLFQIPERPAYGITQAFTTGNDVAYVAAMSVSKAAGGQIRSANKHSSIGHPMCLLVFPVIVVDGQLVEAYLRDDGEMTVAAIDSGVLIWRNPVMHNLHNIITIIRRDCVESFATTMRESCATVFDVARNTIPKLANDREKPT